MYMYTVYYVERHRKQYRKLFYRRFSRNAITRTIRNTLYDEYITVNDILCSDRPTRRVFKLGLNALHWYIRDGRFSSRTDSKESRFIRSSEKSQRTTATVWTIDGSLRSFAKSIIRHVCVKRSCESKESKRPCLL